MELELSAELREFVEEEIWLGHHRTDRAVVADALLRLKADREREVWLKARIDEGIASSEAGLSEAWSVEAAKRRLAARLARAGEDG